MCFEAAAFGMIRVIYVNSANGQRTVKPASGVRQEVTICNPVIATPAAASEMAVVHFESSLSFETDCWDTHFALQSEKPAFVLLDVRGPEHYAAGHVPGAINLPQARITIFRNIMKPTLS
jgi:hypothetical protein